jgi:hypothetical protein
MPLRSHDYDIGRQNSEKDNFSNEIFEDKYADQREFREKALLRQRLGNLLATLCDVTRYREAFVVLIAEDGARPELIFPTNAHPGSSDMQEVGNGNGHDDDDDDDDDDDTNSEGQINTEASREFNSMKMISNRSAMESSRSFEDQVAEGSRVDGALLSLSPQDGNMQRPVSDLRVPLVKDGVQYGDLVVRGVDVAGPNDSATEKAMTHVDVLADAMVTYVCEFCRQHALWEAKVCMWVTCIGQLFGS